MTMICCTLTGVDQNTNPARLEQLAHKFPKAEFGILFSPERSGLQKRFPTFSGIHPCWTPGNCNGPSTCAEGRCRISFGQRSPRVQREENARVFGSPRIGPCRGYN